MSTRAQLWVALGCLLVAAGLFAASWGGEFGGYQFPRVVAVAMILLAVALAVQAWRAVPEGADRDGVESPPWGKILPGLLVLIAYLLLAERLGFFLASLLAFFGLAVLYTPGRLGVAKLARTAAVATGFMAVLYLLFVVLLRVQFPRGLWF